MQEERDKRERIKPEWGGGLAQKREAEAKAKQLQEESSKPFARYKCATLQQPRSERSNV